MQLWETSLTKFFSFSVWLRTKGASAELLKDSAQEQRHDLLHELNFMGLGVKQMV